MRPLRAVEQNITRVSRCLLSGGLAVLPTETVYGLAADATNPDAVQKVFEAKGRPAENPLIVHVGSVEAIEFWCSNIPPGLDALAEAFWPGPLTVILPKHPRVPDIVTAGLDTVALRIPRHTVTLAVLEESGLGLAMPSANVFTGLSPTRADAISPEIIAKIDMILDGGPCRIGIESTVLNLVGDPTILRPGLISEEEIASVLGFGLSASTPTERRSPGQYRKHYAPKIPARLVETLGDTEAGLTFTYSTNPNQIHMPTDSGNYARKLYAALADLETRDLKEILIEMPPRTSEWDAVWDRITKATNTS